MENENIERIAWKVWEEDAKTNPNPVNPHAFVYGFKCAYNLKSNIAEVLNSPTDDVSNVDSDELKLLAKKYYMIAAESRYDSYTLVDAGSDFDDIWVSENPAPKIATPK